MVLEAVLRGLEHPELGINLMDAGLLGIGPPVEIALPEPEGPAARELAERIRGSDPAVEVRFRPLTAAETAAVIARTAGLEGTRILGFIASGPGVGRSTVVWALGQALRSQGRTVGLLEADVTDIELFGRLNLPVPALLDQRIIPRARDGIRVSSLGAFFPAPELPWRGEALAKITRQFLTDVLWNRPDFLLIDLPAGFGEATRTVLGEIGTSELLLVSGPGGSERWERRAEAFAAEVGARLLGNVRNFAFVETAAGTVRWDSSPCLAAFPAGTDGAAFWRAAEELALGLVEGVANDGSAVLGQ